MLALCTASRPGTLQDPIWVITTLEQPVRIFTLHFLTLYVLSSIISNHSHSYRIPFYSSWTWKNSIWNQINFVLLVQGYGSQLIWNLITLQQPVFIELLFMTTKSIRCSGGVASDVATTFLFFFHFERLNYFKLLRLKLVRW